MKIIVKKNLLETNSLRLFYFFLAIFIGIFSKNVWNMFLNAYELQVKWCRIILN